MTNAELANRIYRALIEQIVFLNPHDESIQAVIYGALQAFRPEGTDSDDADRYRWFRDRCDYDRQCEIVEYCEGVADMLDHHIDKGRCGL